MDTIKNIGQTIKESTSNTDPEVLTAYEHASKPPAQHQTLPGTDAEMTPHAEWTKQEAWKDGVPYLREYRGSGKLEGKSAIITGGDSGIGRSVAQMFAREGANVTIVYLPEEEVDAQNVKKAIEFDGRICLLVPLDLTVRVNCEEVVKLHVAQFGSVDILVNNAARQSMTHDVTEMDLDDVELTFRTNILSQFAVVKYAVPHMKPGSAIINSTSVGAYDGSAMASKLSYSSTKGAIATFTRSLSQHLSSKYIRVNAVAPGPIWTPLNVATKDQPESATENMGWKSDRVPLGRIGQPAELGPAYVFLASPDSSYVTGSVIQVNGGSWTGN